MRCVPALLLGILASCCCKSNEEVSRYHEDGRAKPMVAVATMIDTTSFDAPWSVSEELTSMIVKEIAQSKTIFVNGKDEYAFAENPFGNDLNWVKREFSGQEFVAFFELVEHEAVPATKDKRLPKNTAPQEFATNLNLAVRIRVVDIRGATPKVVLQEVVRDTYYIPKSILPTDYTQVVWGTEEYKNTPMGIAHAQIVHEIASRVSDYVMLAKSR